MKKIIIIMMILIAGLLLAREDNHEGHNHGAEKGDHKKAEKKDEHKGHGHEESVEMHGDASHVDIVKLTDAQLKEFDIQLDIV